MTFVLQDGRRPLYIASLNGHLGVVKTLMEAGANINQTSMVGVHYNTFTFRGWGCSCTPSWFHIWMCDIPVGASKEFHVMQQSKASNMLSEFLNSWRAGVTCTCRYVLQGHSKSNHHALCHHVLSCRTLLLWASLTIQIRCCLGVANIPKALAWQMYGETNHWTVIQCTSWKTWIHLVVLSLFTQ